MLDGIVRLSPLSKGGAGYFVHGHLPQSFLSAADSTWLPAGRAHAGDAITYWLVVCAGVEVGVQFASAVRPKQRGARPMDNFFLKKRLSENKIVDSDGRDYQRIQVRNQDGCFRACVGAVNVVSHPQNHNRLSKSDLAQSPESPPIFTQLGLLLFMP